jgi:hypothetical protein
VLFSARVISLLRALILDVLLQLRIAKEDRLRWVMHMLIFYGFILLFLMHAMEKFITVKLFPGYYSTLNPFFYLRDLFGLMVIAGVGIAVYRRFFQGSPAADQCHGHLSIVIVAVIILSGFCWKRPK